MPCSNWSLRGNLEPSAEQIADIAKVGRRSVFRHFSDMDTLYREMNNSSRRPWNRSCNSRSRRPTGTGESSNWSIGAPWVSRKLKPFLLAGSFTAIVPPFLKAAHARFVERLRNILMGILPKDAARNVVLVETLDMLLSFESWSRLREDQGLSIAKSKQVLKQAIELLLKGEAGPDTERSGA